MDNKFDGVIDTFANRLTTAMRIRNIKASELSEKTKIPKSSLSEYINGKYEAKQKSIYLLAKALNVNEAWLMGADVPMERETEQAKKEMRTDFRFASFSGDVEDLDDEDIQKIYDYVDMVRVAKKAKKNQNK